MAHAAMSAMQAWPATAPCPFLFSFPPATWNFPLGRPISVHRHGPKISRPFYSFEISVKFELKPENQNVNNLSLVHPI
jgi:hypothetical protein